MFVPVITIVLIVNSVNACSDTTDRFLDRSRFLSMFSNNHKLNNVSLIGTIGSVTYRHFKYGRTQSLNIKQQLKHGVRVLDLGLAAKSNRFALHTGPIDLGLYFEDVISDVEDFLDRNPREFVIILVREDYAPAEDVTMDNCKIMETYVKKSKRIVTNWKLKSIFKKIRGKILIATQSYGSGFDLCAVNLHGKCLIQNKECKKLKSVDEIDSKWNSILKLQIATFYKKRQCFINNLFYYGSKHSVDVIANHGYVNSDGEYIQPINKRMAKDFLNSHKGLVIVIASFVTQELIDKINFSNFERSDKKDINNVMTIIKV
ncbi:1-phosphatidylinositol phosphodiesterase-like [Cotesia glomerata]|uniref:1-phosphatidylinositol phosphodiesterase-like n=1 Tax=Cotesia glomerata TaxID=32391 RepID=UPI001D0078C4|nr:1-phosphatidylinositol phosphodiesterase-like [Cotesia glomerata]